MSTVYIINKSGHDYHDAERFGSLCYLTSGRISNLDANSIYRDLCRKLKDSTADDYILLTSLPVVSSIACSILARKHGCLNLLIWQKGHYLERNIMIDQLLTEEGE